MSAEIKTRKWDWRMDCFASLRTQAEMGRRHGWPPFLAQSLILPLIIVCVWFNLYWDKIGRQWIAHNYCTPQHICATITTDKSKTVAFVTCLWLPVVLSQCPVLSLFSAFLWLLIHSHFSHFSLFSALLWLLIHSHLSCQGIILRTLWPNTAVQKPWPIVPLPSLLPDLPSQAVSLSMAHSSGVSDVSFTVLG